MRPLACLPTLLLLITYPLSAQDTQARAQALIDQARKVSDIHAPGSPAFQLKATFSFVTKQLDTQQGSYTETWTGESQWRREVAVGDFQEIAIPSARWIVNPMNAPRQISDLPYAMAAAPTAHPNLDFIAIEDHTISGAPAVCTVAKATVGERPPALCFEKKSSVLLEKIAPSIRPKNVVTLTCKYGNFAKFGERLFPHEIRCFEDRHEFLSVSVTELTAAPAGDPTAVTPPAGAIELGICPGRFTPPTEPPPTPFREAWPNDGLNEIHPDATNWSSVKVWFVVDAKGIPRNIEIQSDVGNDIRRRTLKVVEDWHLIPATCDGKSIPMEMEEEAVVRKNP